MAETTDATLELTLAVDGLNDDDIVLDPDSAAKAADSCTVVEAGVEGRFEESRLETIEEVEASTSVDVIAVLDCAVPSVSPTIVEDGTADVAVNDAADGTTDARVELALYDTDEATFDTSRLTLCPRLREMAEEAPVNRRILRMMDICILSIFSEWRKLRR